jgi:hypothetical protein
VDAVVVPVAEVVQELGQDLLPESLRVILVKLRHVYQTLQGKNEFMKVYRYDLNDIGSLHEVFAPLEIVHRLIDCQQLYLLIVLYIERGLSET